MHPGATDVVFVKGAGANIPDRTYLVLDGQSRRVAVHVVHDLAHLVVESLFGLDDGLWAELEQGRHREADRAASARDTKRQKQGRIVSGAATGTATSEWLTPAHQRAKAITNCVTAAPADGIDAPASVRSELSALDDAAIGAVLDRVDDDTIVLAVRGVRDLRRVWAELPEGEAMRLTWPMERAWFDPGSG